MKARKQRKAGVSREEMLRRFRNRGFSKADSVELKRAADAASKVLGNVGVSQAKRRKVNYRQACQDLMAIGPVKFPPRKPGRQMKSKKQRRRPRPAKVKLEKRQGFTVGVLARPINEKAVRDVLANFP